MHSVSCIECITTDTLAAVCEESLSSLFRPLIGCNALSVILNNSPRPQLHCGKNELINAQCAESQKVSDTLWRGGVCERAWEGNTGRVPAALLAVGFVLNTVSPCSPERLRQTRPGAPWPLWHLPPLLQLRHLSSLAPRSGSAISDVIVCYLAPGRSCFLPGLDESPSSFPCESPLAVASAG